MAKPVTNVSRVMDLMTHGSPMMQVFVVIAIEKYAEQCLEAGPAVFHNAFMDGQAWVACAQRAKDWSEDHASQSQMVGRI